MRSSPISSRIADTNAWNDAFVGGKPIRPFHSGFVKSRIESGRSRGLQLARVVGHDARARGHADPAALRVAVALGRLARRRAGGQRRELRLDRSERARVLREEDVGGRVVALLLDLRGQLGRVAVADLDLQARSRFSKSLTRSPIELLVAAGVDRQVGVLTAAAGGRDEHEQGEEDRGDTAHGEVPQEGKDDDRAVVHADAHVGAERHLLVRRALRPEVGAVGQADAVEDVVAEEGALDDLGGRRAVRLEADELRADEHLDVVGGGACGRGQLAERGVDTRRRRRGPG